MAVTVLILAVFFAVTILGFIKQGPGFLKMFWVSSAPAAIRPVLALLAAHAQAGVGIGGAVEPEEVVQYAGHQIDAGAHVLVLIEFQFDFGAADEGLPRCPPDPRH